MKKLFYIGLSIFLIFGIIGTILWFTVNHKFEKQESYEKVFKNDKIEQIIVNGHNTDVEVKKGKHLNVKYDGKDKVNASVENKLLHFSERDKKLNLSFNFIPFKKTKNHLIITLPKKNYDAFNITTNTGNVSVKNVMSDNSNIITGTGNITYEKVKMKNAKAMSDLGSIRVSNSSLIKFNGELDTGNITVDKSKLINSELITNLGNINVKRLKNECDIKSSTEDGDITLSYNKPPKNTLLQLQAESGETKITNHAFNGEKVGSGKHVIEGYTVNGDIYVK
nr:DUF4097 domain-containing protein [Mammaliicoccus sp. Marseille-Q6498]